MKTLPALFTFAFATTAAALFTGCGKTEAPPAPEPVRPVKIVTLGSGEMQRMLELPGQMQAFREASLGFEVPGLVQEVLVNEGDDVTAGQVLARLDDRDYRAARDAAQAELAAARSEANRSQSLYDRQATSKQRLDLALAQLQVAESSYDRAAKALADTELRAPMDGSIARVYVEDIVNVQAKKTILLLQDLSQIKVTVDVPETVAVLIDPRVPEEERLRTYTSNVYLTTGSKRAFPARVIETAKVADPTTRTYAATLVFERPEDINILPGMTARLQVDITEFVRPEGDWFQVPGHAIVGQDDGSSYVWQVDPATMTVSATPVQVGRMSGALVEIRADALSAGDQVAASGILHLREGMQVHEFSH